MYYLPMAYLFYYWKFVLLICSIIIGRRSGEHKTV